MRLTTRTMGVLTAVVLAIAGDVRAETVLMTGSGKNEDAAVLDAMTVHMNSILAQEGQMQSGGELRDWFWAEVKRQGGVRSFFKGGTENRCGKVGSGVTCRVAADFEVFSAKSIISNYLKNVQAQHADKLKFALAPIGRSCVSDIGYCNAVISSLKSKMADYGFYFYEIDASTTSNQKDSYDYGMNFKSISFSDISYNPSFGQASGSLSVIFEFSNSLTGHLIAPPVIVKKAERSGSSQSEAQALLIGTLAEEVAASIIGQINSQVASSLQDGAAQMSFTLIFSDNILPRQRPGIRKRVEDTVEAFIKNDRVTKARNKGNVGDNENENIIKNLATDSFAVRQMENIDMTGLIQAVYDEFPEEEYKKMSVNYIQGRSTVEIRF